MKILAVDYGDSRIRPLATCDRTEFLTTAITPQITLKAATRWRHGCAKWPRRSEPS